MTAAIIVFIVIGSLFMGWGIYTVRDSKTPAQTFGALIPLMLMAVSWTIALVLALIKFAID